ncbi:RNA-binding cell elongation regulator Jag/EloR [Kallotenue papyrolyticum]|uniref:RNA-binding cell elongation regulator Jag/EloR n=1 Tax=Kallotenue papyrolyticum TaxID=1325125 RepID=UPI000492D466|nr:RNA-binding cell elongation regulator Jag/EloR [Kallotenue papyrolyticum]
MPSIEISARTIAEATRLALEQLGVDEDEAIIEVLQSGDEENEALVRVSTLDVDEPSSRRAPYDPEAAAREGRRILEGILRHMDVDGFVNVQHTTALGPDGETQHSIMLYVEGLDEETVGLLIGRRGETLRSLQFLVNTIVQRHLGRWPQLVIDIGNYRQRRQESLEGLARRVAEQVRATGKPQSLDPMQAYDRRIIHMALRDDATVYTESAGEGENRHVVIYPRK